MMAVVPACPACGEDIDNADGQVVYHNGEDAVCDHCETFLTCEDGVMVIDYEEDHHRLSKEVKRLRETLAEVRASRAELRVHCEIFAGRIDSAASTIDVLRSEVAWGRWTTRKALALIDDGNVEHARRTLAHAMRLATPSVVG
jgi:hypothetical protein